MRSSADVSHCGVSGGAKHWKSWPHLGYSLAILNRRGKEGQRSPIRWPVAASSMHSHCPRTPGSLCERTLKIFSDVGGPGGFDVSDFLQGLAGTHNSIAIFCIPSHWHSWKTQSWGLRSSMCHLCSLCAAFWRLVGGSLEVDGRFSSQVMLLHGRPIYRRCQFGLHQWYTIHYYTIYPSEPIYTPFHSHLPLIVVEKLGWRDWKWKKATWVWQRFKAFTSPVVWPRGCRNGFWRRGRSWRLTTTKALIALGWFGVHHKNYSTLRELDT